MTLGADCWPETSIRKGQRTGMSSWRCHCSRRRACCSGGLIFADIRKGHLNGKLKDDEIAFVDFPGVRCEAGTCGKLRRLLYGMRQAANAWGQHYFSRMKEFRMMKGRFAPSVFDGAEREPRCVVHSDGFTFLGWRNGPGEAVEFLSKHHELKARGVLGGGAWGLRYQGLEQDVAVEDGGVCGRRLACEEYLQRYGLRRRVQLLGQPFRPRGRGAGG